MDFRPANFKSGLAAVFAAGALVCSAQADGTMIFSVPVDDDSVQDMNARSDAAAQSSRAANVYRAPASTFNLGPNLPLPPPQPLSNPAWQKAQNDRKNWMLMTPEEVMGVQTPTKILGLQDPNDDSNLTPEQRFLKRQEDARLSMIPGGATNSSGQFGLAARDNSDPFSRLKAANSFSQSQNDDSSASSFRALRMANEISGTPSSSFSALGSLNSPFANNATLGPTSAQKKADLQEQAAAMDRFRALMGASSSTANPPLNSTTPLPANDSSQSTSLFDAMGHRILTTGDDFNKPAMPSTVSGLSSAPPKVPVEKRESWRPQLPPWLLSDTVPTTPPTAPPIRKF